MKIICIGRNYKKHAEELENEVPKEPVIFMKPETALIPKRNPFFIPDFSNKIHYEAELVIKISKPGKHIQTKYAYKYWEQLSVGIDFTARDVQKMLKEKGLPWEKAKAFDGSAAVGKFIPKKDLDNPENIHFQLFKNEELMQDGHSADMIFSIDQIISHVSSYFMLKLGDLIFTGTPEGVGPVHPGESLALHLEGQKLLSLHVK